MSTHKSLGPNRSTYASTHRYPDLLFWDFKRQCVDSSHAWVDSSLPNTEISFISGPTMSTHESTLRCLGQRIYSWNLVDSVLKKSLFLHNWLYWSLYLLLLSTTLLHTKTLITSHQQHSNGIKRSARRPSSHTGNAPSRSYVPVTALSLLSDDLAEIYDKKFKNRTVIKKYFYSPLVDGRMRISYWTY